MAKNSRHSFVKAVARGLIASVASIGLVSLSSPADASAAVNCSTYASGGTATAIVIDDVTFCRHVFSTVGSANFTVFDSRITVIDYLIVAGGGGGAGRDVGGGGGAGGVVSNLKPGGTSTPGLSITANTAIEVVVGAGGAGSSLQGGTGTGGQGGPSRLGALIAAGGGGGGNYGVDGAAGGSGGGGGRISAINSSATPAGQGNVGGRGAAYSNDSNQGGGGGGGGAGSAGSAGQNNRGGNGGAGLDYSALLGSDVGGDNGRFAGGGAGASHRCCGIAIAQGGIGGGGNESGGTDSTNVANRTGKASTGGGGGASRGENITGGSGGSGIVVIRYSLPPASSGICDGSSTQNGLTVTAGHGSMFYIDSAIDQKIDASYLAYSVGASSAASGLWVELAAFSGGVVSLAGPSQALHPLDPITSGGSQTAFAMVKATSATKIAQSHQVRVYDKKPISSSIRPLYVCSFSFVEVREAIKANSNKIESITATQEITLGGELVITVLGDTGTIGNGNAVDGRVVWLSPAARSDWPSASMRLENTTITFFSNSQRTTQISTHNNVLRISSKSSPELASASRQYYTAVYTFRVVNAATSAVPIIPVAMISSGAQVKNTALKSVMDSNSTVNLASPKVDVNLTKDVNTTTSVNTDGTTTVDYTITMKNNGSSSVSIDEVIDTPDDQLSYVPGTSELSGTPIDDPFLLPTGELNYSGPITIAAGQTREITYQMRAVTCAPGGQFSFTNTATARIGTVVVGSSTATRSLVNLNGDCGVEVAVKSVEEVALDPEVFTGTASNTTQNTATVTGFVDSNGQAGLPVRFRYSLLPDLSASSLVAAGTTDASDSPVAYEASLSTLQPGRTYYYRAEAVVADEKVFFGDTLTFATNPVPAPPTVSTTAATNVTTSSATLTGLVSANQVANGLKVSFEWEEAASCQPHQSALSGAGLTSGFLQTENATNDGFEDSLYGGQSEAVVDFPISSLVAGASYCFRVIGHHGVGYQTRVIGDWVAFSAIARASQQIVWDTRMDVLVAGGSTRVFAISVKTSDGSRTGLDVGYQSVDESICTVTQAGTVQAIATRGVCVITATQAGDATYAPATSATLAIEISTPTITTTSLANGTYRSASPYSQALIAEGGAGNYDDWQLVPGDTLPAGLTLDPQTGVISGTPVEAGIFQFRVTTTSGGIVTDPVALTVTIGKALAVITASTLSVEFGDPNPFITPSYSGFLSTDTVADSVVTAPVCDTDYTVGSNAGTTAITRCKDAWSEKYSFSYVNGTVTVTKKTITFRALDATKQNLVDADNNIVASADPDFSFTFSPALPSGQNLDDVLDGAVTFTRAPGETPGDYLITPSATAKSGGNYQTAVATGKLTIQTPKYVPAIEISGSPLNLVYGQTLSGKLSPTTTSTIGPVDGSFSYRDAAGNPLFLDLLLPAGLHTVVIEFEASDTANFVGFVQRSFTITVSPAPLDITAISYSKKQGSLDPVLSFVIASRVGSESEAEFGKISVTRAPGESVGGWAVTSSGGSHNNYTLNHIPGALYIYALSITTAPASGIVQSRTVSFQCAGLDPGTPVTVTLTNTQETLRQTVADANGECQFTADVPTSIEFGLISMSLTGFTPNADQVSTSALFTLFREGTFLASSSDPSSGAGAGVASDSSSTDEVGANDTGLPLGATDSTLSASGSDDRAADSAQDSETRAAGEPELHEAEGAKCGFPWWPILLIVMVFSAGQILNRRVNAHWLTRKLLATSLLPPTAIAILVGIWCGSTIVAAVGTILGLALAAISLQIPGKNREIADSKD